MNHVVRKLTGNFTRWPSAKTLAKAPVWGVIFQGEDMEISEISSSISSQNLYRQSLVPAWIRVFGWLFICFAVLVTFAFFAALFNPDAPISLNIFGVFYTGTPFHTIPVSLFVLILVNAFVGYGLLSGKSWALTASLVVGCIILATTFIGKATYPTDYFPFEPILILLYLFVLYKLKGSWQYET